MPGLIYHVLLNVTNNPYEKYAFSVKTLKLRILVRRFELFFISIHNFKNLGTNKYIYIKEKLK